MENDSYLTINKPTQALFKEKGSKFFAYTFNVSTEKQIKAILDELKEEHSTSRHVCYAYSLGIHPNFKIRMNDAGEPNNTAGKPIYGQIQSFNLTNVLVVVVRYFGGTKLGVGGLITAYKTAAKEALEEAEIVKKYVGELINMEFTYQQEKQIKALLNQYESKIIEQNFGVTCKMRVEVRVSKKKEFIFQLQKTLGNEI